MCSKKYLCGLMRLIRFHVGKSALNIHQEKRRSRRKKRPRALTKTHRMQYIFGSHTVVFFSSCVHKVNRNRTVVRDSISSVFVFFLWTPLIHFHSVCLFVFILLNSNHLGFFFQLKKSHFCCFSLQKRGPE